MVVKTKQSSGRTYYYLSIPERGGHSGDSVKTIEHTVYVGQSLQLSADRWLELLRESPVFRRIPLDDVLAAVETYVRKRGLPANTIDGLREAVHGPTRHKAGSRMGRPKEHETDEYAAALKLLGVPPGSSDRAIESAFKKCARRHHPDVGGDTGRFRELLAARDLLLGRQTTSPTSEAARRGHDS